VVKAVFLDRVNIISEYENEVHSPSFTMRLPSVISLKEFVQQSRRPAFTRFNVFLRDRFRCQYCAETFPTHELTFDHVVPRSRGGRTSWSTWSRRARPATCSKAAVATRGGHAPTEKAPAAQYSRAAGERSSLPAKLSAPELAGFPLLGHRARNELSGGRTPSIHFFRHGKAWPCHPRVCLPQTGCWHRNLRCVDGLVDAKAKPWHDGVGAWAAQMSEHVSQQSRH
jgi:hypothetical protein